MSERRTPSPEEADRRTAGDLLTRGSPVSQALALTGIRPCVVPQEADVEAVARALAACQGVNTVAVIDAEGKLAGIIPVRVLMDEMFLHIAPEEFLKTMKGEDVDLEEMGRITRARTAAELMQEPVSVTPEETVRDAFVRMHEHRLEGVPVVDRERRPVGYLDRFQLLRLWLEARRR